MIRWMPRTCGLARTVLLPVLLGLAGACLAQERPAATPSAGPAASHDTHDEEAAATGSAAQGLARPGWVWPLALALLLGAGAVPSLLRRNGVRGSAKPVSVALLLAAVVLLVVTKPVPAVAEDDHEAHDQAADSALVEVEPDTAAALGLETETLAPSELATGIDTTGRILAVEARQAHLGSRIAGRLTAVRAKVGSRVGAGEVVATLDSLDAARAAAAWREADARLEAAKDALAARRELVASGSFAAAPLEEVRRQLADARVAQAGVASELARARNEAESARAELLRTQRLAEGGAYTTAAVEAARGKLSEAELALAEADAAVSGAEADQTGAAGAVDMARARVASAAAVAEQTSRLVATGELDRAPLEQARNTLAAARAKLQQAEAGLAQARGLAARGEELHRSELISLNDLEGRRTSLREREAQRAEAETAVANATAALARAEQISTARMASGRAEQETRNALSEARGELAAAEARGAKAEARLSVVERGVAPARAAVEAARAALRRETALAGDETRSRSAVDAAKLRLVQAERLAAGKDGELVQMGRKVDVASAAVLREERLAASQVRGREQLLESDREVRASRIARDNAAEVLALLGASSSAAARSRGPVRIPIRSPISGIVTSLEASLGEAVSAEQELLTVVDLSEVYLEADVSETDLPGIQPGQLARARLRAFPGESFVGAVVSISGELDPETRAAHVRVRLENPTWRLRPGMFATVGFVTDRATGVLTVPSEAVQEIEGREVVFVQRAPGQYELRPVSPGRLDGDRVEVVAGLAAGETVVTRGSYLLKAQRLKGELGEGHAH